MLLLGFSPFYHRFATHSHAAAAAHAVLSAFLPCFRFLAIMLPPGSVSSPSFSS